MLGVPRAIPAVPRRDSTPDSSSLPPGSHFTEEETEAQSSAHTDIPCPLHPTYVPSISSTGYPTPLFFLAGLMGSGRLACTFTTAWCSQKDKEESECS